jgi:WD40 repeat protein
VYAQFGRIPAAINTIAFNSGGDLVAAGGEEISYDQAFDHDISLGDDEKVLIWDVATRKRKYLLEDSVHRWGQITCLSWLGDSRQNNGLAILGFGTARGLVVIYRQSRTEVSACHSSHICTTH